MYTSVAFKQKKISLLALFLVPKQLLHSFFPATVEVPLLPLRLHQGHTLKVPEEAFPIKDYQERNKQARRRIPVENDYITRAISQK